MCYFNQQLHLNHLIIISTNKDFLSIHNNFWHWNYLQVVLSYLISCGLDTSLTESRHLRVDDIEKSCMMCSIISWQKIFWLQLKWLHFDYILRFTSTLVFCEITAVSNWKNGWLFCCWVIYFYVNNSRIRLCAIYFFNSSLVAWKC